MDADCLIKLTKSGAKEAIVSAFEVHIPPLVKKEVVDIAKMRGYQDAFVIEENIHRKALRITSRHAKRSETILASKGEVDVLSLYEHGKYDAIASDDQKFIKKLAAAHIPYLTPSACLVYLQKTNRLGAAKALEMLESLKPFISREEYVVTKLYLEAKP